MTYTIGIGVLIEGDQFNKLRSVELSLTDKTGNTSGLSQPPHITVKRPFDVADVNQIAIVRDTMRKIAEKTKCFNVRLSGTASFSRNVHYACPLPSEALIRLHKDLLDSLKSLGVEPNEFEADNVTFHSTLAMDLTESEFEIAAKELKSTEIDMDCLIGKIGLFLGLANNTNWVVIDIANLQ